MIIDELNSPVGNDGKFGSAHFADFNPKPAFELKVSEITCPSCGGPAMDGEVRCSYCGVGLHFRLVTEGGSVKFMYPPGAIEFKREQLAQDFDKMIAKMIKKTIELNVPVYIVMPNGVPLVVDKNTSAEQAEKNWRDLKTALKRAELGNIWTAALLKYKEFADRIVQLPPEVKTKVINAIEKFEGRKMGFKTEDFEKFFARPSVDLALEISKSFPICSNDAEYLQAFVKKYSKFIDSALQKK